MSIGKDSNLQRLVPLRERVATEGELYWSLCSTENSTITDAMSLSSFLFWSVSRAFFIEEIVVSSNRAVVLQISLGASATQATAQQIIRVSVPANGVVHIPVQQAIRPHQNSPAGSTSALGGVTIRKVLDTTTTGAYIFATAYGYAIYDDFNFAADKVGLVIGDSILNSTAGVTSKSQSMEWLTRGHFQVAGTNLRLINKSISGSTTADHETRRALGVFDFPQVDYIHYMLGTNDAGNGVASAVTQANAAAMIAWKRQRYPNATMVVYGPTPRSDTFETNLIAARTALQAAVTAANDPKVLYCSLAAAFDRTNTGNYAASDAIHPNATGHAAAYAVIDSFLTANSVRL